MAADYLSYWKPATVRQVLEEESSLLDHAASEQYGRVSPGDTVWIVTAWSGGHLMLLGPILVDQRTDAETAARILRSDDLWEASHHILAPRGREAPARDVDIGDLAADLRFESAKDRLDLRDRSKIASQLQSMRRLTPASGALLRERWGEEAGYADALADARVRGGAGFGSAASNAEVEQAAIAMASEDLRGDGWAVQSVERERIGYDLLCTRGDGDGREERHVEVKGARGPSLGFIITEGEVRRAEDDPNFWLYLVTGALGIEARLHRYSAEELLRTFTFVPLAFRAVPAVP